MFTTFKIIHLILVLPYLNGPAEKEVKDDQGSDVKLTCDVVGYPIRFEWKDEEDNAIGNSRLFRCSALCCTDVPCFTDNRLYQ